MTLILTIAFWQCMKKDLDKKQSKSFIESFLEYIVPLQLLETSEYALEWSIFNNTLIKIQSLI